MTQVTIQDIRAARYCLAGVRPWFRRQGLDWQEFLESGIDADRLRTIGDALIEPVIAQAEARETKATAIAPATAPATTRIALEARDDR